MNEKIDYLDFLIVGAARSGTTSLYVYLKQHPEINFPESNKEPGFFIFVGTDEDSSTINKYEIRDARDYRNLFDIGNKDYKSGESSTAYLYKHDVTISNIKKFVNNWKDLKIIIMLRNPVERAYSHYLLFVQEGYESRVFKDCIKNQENNKSIYSNYIGYGMYYSQVKAYLDNFNDVQVIIFDDYKENPEKCMNSICDYLGVGKFNEINISKSYNKTAYPRFKYAGSLKNNRISQFLIKIIPKTITSKIRKILFSGSVPELGNVEKEILIDIYREDINKLSGLLKKDLSFWLV